MREASMTKPDWKYGTTGSGVDWTGLIKIVAVQVVVLLALAAAAIAYVNWASEAAMAEFARSNELTLSAPPQVAPPKQVASGSKRQCEHR
jgi:hypothetical protein